MTPGARTTSSSSTSTSTSSTSTIAAGPISTQIGDASADSGLPSGTVAGVAIGTLLGGVILALGGVIWFVKRRKQRGMSAKGVEQPSLPFENGDGVEGLSGRDAVNSVHVTEETSSHGVLPDNVEMSPTPRSGVETRRELEGRGPLLLMAVRSSSSLHGRVE